MCVDANRLMHDSRPAPALIPLPRLRVLSLSFYPAEGPSVRHRIGIYASRWHAAGIDLTLKSFMTQALYRRRRRFGIYAALYKAAQVLFGAIRMLVRLLRLRDYDIVIIHREIFPLGGALFETLVARRAARLIYDFDDALWLPMPLSINQRGQHWDPNRFAQMIKSATAVVAGNQYLGDYAAAQGAHVHIIPTPYHDLHAGALANQVTGVHPIIVWIGNVGNDEYLEIVRRPLERLAQEWVFTVRIIGNENVSAFRIAGVDIDGREWQDDREVPWLLECAIGIMPLFDRDYERGKCGFKIIQYFSAGMPVVASPVGINAEIIDHDHNGFLASTEDEWYAALKCLLTDPDRRRRMGAAAYTRFRERFTIEDNANAWIAVMRETGSH